MKITKVQAALIVGHLPILQIPAGRVVLTAEKKLLMRVKPTGFLLNSTVIGDVITRGDALVLDLAKGTMYAVSGATLVQPIISELTWSE